MTDRKRKIDLGATSTPATTTDDGLKKKRSSISDLIENDEHKYNTWTGEPYSEKYYSILEKRVKLPVYQFKDDLLAKVMENQCVVVEGETGTLFTFEVVEKFWMFVG